MASGELGSCQYDTAHKEHGHARTDHCVNWKPTFISGVWAFWDDPGGRVQHRIKETNSQQAFMACGVAHWLDQLVTKENAPKHRACLQGDER